MELAITRLMLATQSSITTLVDRARNQDDGEGVISAAIAVLIMAFLGAAMWIAFKLLFDNAAEKTAETVNQIGQ